MVASFVPGGCVSEADARALVEQVCHPHGAILGHPSAMTAALQIRSITLGFSASPNQLGPLCAQAGRFLQTARTALTDGGFSVQTTRVCTQPANEITAPDHFARFARALEAASGEAQVDYCAAGSIEIRGDWTTGAAAAAITEAILDTERFFTSARLDASYAPNAEACLAAAAAIVAISCGSERGFGNLRFAGAARCPANVPFFPAAFHEGQAPRFSIAVQWADLLGEATGGSDSLANAMQRVVETISDWGGRLQDICEFLERDHGVQYAGLDLTPAPFPTEEQSIGAAIESLGVSGLGAPGTLAAVAALTRTLKSVGLRRAGFSGVMLPVLEDSVLARRVSEGRISISELLLYSAVCGTGLDTVPLPGDVTEEEVGSLLLDVATLAVALDKPLTARLFPVPGKAAGDMTDFDFPYFANARVMAVKGMDSEQLLNRMGV
jgi:uncharacterized protein